MYGGRHWAGKSMQVDAGQGWTNLVVFWAPVKRFESVHPNIYSIYELWEHMKEQVLQN